MSSATVRCASVLMDWLNKRTAVLGLPRMAAIAAELPGAADAYRVAEAMSHLNRTGVIAMRHGTRSEKRGHYAIRILSSGVVLKTSGCPFDPP